MVDRRTFLLAGAGLAGAALLTRGRMVLAQGALAEGTEFPFTLSDAQWREKLSDMQYFILREHGTEHAFTSPLDKIYDAGTYHCAGCDQALYSSEVKFDSRTGWPSFWEALPDAVGTSMDTTLWVPRVECHCANCGGHLGHIFDDGPPPTGKRHCINGVALSFVAA